MTWSRRGRWFVLFGFAALVGLVLVAWQSWAGGARERPSAPSAANSVPEWAQEARRAFRFLTEGAPRYVDAAYDWSQGSLADSDFAKANRAAANAFSETLDRLGDLPAVAGIHATLAHYRECAQLYVEGTNIHDVALTAPPGPARAELDLLARRVRLLGDPVYDLGRVALDAALEGRPPRQEEVIVPVWSDEGLSPGRLLRSSSSIPTPPEEDGVPMSDVRTVLIGGVGSPEDMGALADRLERASDRLSRAPGPASEELNRRRLAWLVWAESARAGAGANLVAGAASVRLREVSGRLREVGEAILQSARP